MFCVFSTVALAVAAAIWSTELTIHAKTSRNPPKNILAVWQSICDLLESDTAVLEFSFVKLTIAKLCLPKSTVAKCAPYKETSINLAFLK